MSGNPGTDVNVDLAANLVREHMFGVTVCPKCQWVHVACDAVALSRFAAVTGFRTPDGEIHATREDAQEWLCEQRRDQP